MRKVMEFEELKRVGTMTWFEIGQQTVQAKTVYCSVMMKQRINSEV